MSAMETILVFVVIPLVIYGVISAMTLRTKFSKPRYRPGQEWEFPAQWWIANPEGVGNRTRGETSSEQSTDTTVAAGGARGSW